MRKRERKPIGKRLLSLFLAFAMVLTMVQLPGAEKVQAAEVSVKLYFELPEETNAGDWAVNAWGTNVNVSGGSDVRIGGNWGGQVKPSLLSDDKVGWGYVTVSGTVSGFQFVQWVKDDKDSTTEPTKYDCWNAQIAEGEYTEAYFSPSDEKWYTSSEKTHEIKEPEIRNIFVLAGDSGLAGSNWNEKDMNNKLTQDSSDTNKFSITYTNVSPGTYSYKILQDPENKGWSLPWGNGSGGGGNRSVIVSVPSNVTFTIDLTDPNKDVIDQGVTVTMEECLVKKLEIDTDYAVKGGSNTLSSTGVYYNGQVAAGTEVSDITYELKQATDGASMSGNTITLTEAFSGNTIDVVAKHGTYSQDITLKVVDTLYIVNFRMYSQSLEMTPGVSDIYVFYKDSEQKNNEFFVQTTGTFDDKNSNNEDIKWVTGALKIPSNSFSCIIRDQAGVWAGQDSKGLPVTLDGTEAVNEVTLWYEYGKTPTTTKPTIQKTEQRYFYLEYENAALATDKNPQFYSWTTGYAATLIDFEASGDGKWLVKVPVKPTCSKVDFVIALDATGDPWVKDGGDHSISFPLDQTVVCASMKKGEEPQLSAPYNMGYELQPKKNQISFYYRDDSALVAGTLADLTVAVDIGGTEQPMTYNSANKRFECVSTLADGRTYYRYKVGNEYVLDKYNANQEEKDSIIYSYVDYYKLNATISAEVMNASFNYNENNVVKFTVNQASTDEKKLEVATAFIDVSSLGGSSKLAIVPDLQAVTISVTMDTPLGTKTLPITVTDQYGNEYTTSVDVQVVARTKTDDNDFDWDEAVIYFMVTDRFFDGNATNNTASGENTYGINEGLYHGGDFAGVTAKLDYLKELGINTIWITPIVENIPGVTVTDPGKDDVPYNAAYHGYWASDFTKLNPTLGTEEEFATLIREAHNHGIRIMVDIVVNHAGYETTFGNMIRSGDEIVANDDQKDSLANLPDFRTEDPAVSEKLVEWQTQWVKDFGIDYFRVDTVKHVEGETWSELKNSLTEVDPDFKMIGEYAGGGYASNGGTLGTGQMDSDLDFDFNDQATNFVSGKISDVESFLANRNAALNNTYLTGQFLGSHDEDGFKQNLISGKGMSEEAATAASLVAATLQITAKGQPVIYYGEEIGLTGLNNYPYQTNRYDFDWSLVNDENVTYQHYKTMLAIRNEYTDVFARGDRKAVAVSDADGYDVVSRSYGGTTLYVGMNIKSAAQTVAVPVSESNGSVMTDLYSGQTYVVSNGVVYVSIPAAANGGTVVLKKTGNTSSGGGSVAPSTPSTPDNTTVTKNPDGTTTETKTETSKNEAGNEVTVTVTTEKDADGNVTASKEVSVIEEVAENTSATVTVEKNASGEVTDVTATVETTGTSGKTNVTVTISGDVVAQLTEAAGTSDVEISVTVTAGKKSYTVQADAEDLTAGNKLKVVAVNVETGKYVLVNAKTYTVGKDGDVKVALPSGQTYELVTKEEAAAIEKSILKTVKVKKSSASVKKGKTTTVQMNSKLDMKNVSKITYTSNKTSVATVTKSGKVKAKKKGTATVKVKVTLKNGTTKTVTMKITVK